MFLWCAIVAIVLVAVAFAVAIVLGRRRAFLRHVQLLQSRLEQSHEVGATPAVLPDVVINLSRHLVGQSKPGRLVRLTQRGQMWMKPRSHPTAFTAQQTISLGEVGFLWQARLAGPAGLSIHVIDYLVGENAGLEARLLGAIPVARMTDTDAAFRGEAMRYLAELIWAPDAILSNPLLEWRVLDARTLAVAVGAGNRRGEVRLILDQRGDVARIEADDRPRTVGNAIQACPWFGRASDYRAIAGRRIPFQAEVGWIVDGNEFVYWRGSIETWSIES